MILDKQQFRKDITEAIRDLQQLNIVLDNIQDEKLIIQSLEKTLFNLSCVVAGFWHDFDDEVYSY